MKLSLTLSALMIAAPAFALEPINKEPHINNILLQGFIGDAIADNCPALEPRKLRALGELNKLRVYALDKGYTTAQVRAFVTSDTEKARGKAEAAEWLKAQRQTGAAWVELAKELREVAAEVSSAAQSARSASRGWHWKLWLTVMLASMMPTVVLLIASLLLLDLTPLTTEDGSIWLRLVAR